MSRDLDAMSVEDWMREAEKAGRREARARPDETDAAAANKRWYDRHWANDRAVRVDVASMFIGGWYAERSTPA